MPFIRATRLKRHFYNCCRLYISRYIRSKKAITFQLIHK